MRLYENEETIVSWCKQNEIDFVQHHVITDPNTFESYYFWEIKDEKQRVMFTLKWST